MKKTNKSVSEETLNSILEEIKIEQNISPFIDVKKLLPILNEGVYFISNEICNFEIDYEIDLSARSLLKNYFMYANHSRLAEFKEIYQSEYIALQEKYYYKNTEL